MAAVKRLQAQALAELIGAANMAKTFRVFLPDGRSPTVEAETAAEVYQIFREEAPDIAAEGIFIRDTETGAEQYVSPERSITDPERVARLREGMDTRAEARRAMSEDIVESYPISSRVASGVQGLPITGEYADELAGSLPQAVNIGLSAIPFVGERLGQAAEDAMMRTGSYGPQATESMRRQAEAFQEVRPTEAMLTQLGVGLVSSVPLAFAAAPSAGVGLGRAAIQSGLTGGAGAAVEGAISGYGAGEDPQSRLINARNRALAGAGIGGALGFGLPIAGAVAGKLASQTVGQLPMLELSRSLGLSPEAARVAGAARQFEQGAPIAAPTRPASLAETSEEMRGLLDAAVSVPSAGRAEAINLINTQAREASEGLTATLDDVLGEPKSVRVAQREMMRDTAQEREDLYSTAYNTRYNMDDPRVERLTDLVERVDDSVLREANRIMTREGVRSNQMRFKEDANGNIIGFEELPDIRQIDYITRALQSRVNTQGASPEDVRTFGSLVRDIRETADELVPAYRDARSRAAEIIGEREAMDFGEEVLSSRLNRGDVQIGIENMTPGELNSVRSGMREYIDGVMARVSRPLDPDGQEAKEAVRALRELTSREAQDKIRLVLGDEAGDAFIARLQNAVEPLAVRAVGGNSATAGRQFAIETAREEIQPGMFERIASGQSGLQQEAAGLLSMGSEGGRNRLTNIMGEVAPFTARQRSPESLARLRELLGQVPAASELPENILRAGIRGGSVAGVAAGPTAARAAQEFGLAQPDVRRMR